MKQMRKPLVSFLCFFLFVFFIFKLLYPDADLLADPIGDKLSNIETRFDKWMMARPSKYKLRIALKRWDCEVIFEVQNEEIISDNTGSCDRLRTVTKLFEELLTDTLNYDDGACYDMVPLISYDDILHYPKDVEYISVKRTSSTIGWWNYIKIEPLGSLTLSECGLLFKTKIGFIAEVVPF